MWYQQTIALSAKSRGFHLITDEVSQALKDLDKVKIGIIHLLLLHTSASLTLNENGDSTVRHDMENYFLASVPERAHYQHAYEGDDDMPAHIKSSLLGTSLVLPIKSGRFVLGQWQGIWLGEHRNQGGSRRIVATLTGS